MAKKIGFYSFYDGCWYYEYWYTSRGCYMRAQGLVGCYMGSPVRCSGAEYHQNLCRVISGKVRRDFVSESAVAILDNGDKTPS